MVEARGEMSATEKHGGTSFASLGKASGLALAAVATVGAGIGVASVKMASTFEDSRARLERAVSNSGSSFSKVAGQVSAYEGRLEKLGFTHTQTDDALATLTTALGSPAKAMAALGLAADLARYKHIGLSEASIVVAKAEEGQLRPLKQLGIDLPIVASTAEKVKVAQENLGKAQAAVNAILAKSPDAINPASKAHAAYERALGKVSDAQKKVSDLSTAGGKIMDALGKKIGGQAATAAGTFGGKLEVAKAKVEDLGISLGLKLIPVIEQVISAISKVVGWFEKHKSAAIALAVVVGTVLVGAIVVFVAATIAGMTAATAATGGIILAIGLLAAGIVYLAAHWKQVWADIKQWTADAVNWIQDHLYLIAGIILGPFGLAIVWLGKHWKEIWDAMKTVVRDFVGFFTGAGGWLLKAGKDVTDGLWAGLRWPWDHIIKPFFDGIKTLFVDFFTRGAGSWLIKGGKDVLSGLWAGIKAVWNATVAPWFRDIVRPIAGFFATAVTWLVKAGVRIITGMFNGIASVMRGAASWLTVNVFAPIVRFYAGALTWLLRAGSDIMRGLFNGLWSVVSTLGGWLMEHMLRPLMRFFALAVGWLFHAGGDIIAGLFHGIASAMANVGSWINSHVVQPVIHAVKHFFGIKSPSTLMTGIGVNVMEGFIAGLLKANPMKVVKTVFGSVAHGAKMIFDAAGGLASGLFGAIGGQQKIGLGGLAPGFKFGEPGGTALQNQAVAQQMAAAMGWTGIQWQALNNVEMREAGWSMTAKNPSSNAYGIAQFINGPGEYAQYGGNATTLSGQLIGFFNYIKQRYGTPDNAWAHEVAFGWYDKGGRLPPGLSLALNTTGRAEVVRPGPGSGGATYVLNFNGPVIGEGGMRAVARQLRVAIERDARAGTPTFVL